jgi:hypothetical protein
MTANTLERELKALPEMERTQIIRAALPELSATALKTLERQLRRLAHPEVPEDVCTGFEEAEDGKAIEIRDEHFEQTGKILSIFLILSKYFLVKNL